MMMNKSDMLLGVIILVVLFYSLLVCGDRKKSKLTNKDCVIIAIALVILVVVYLTYIGLKMKKVDTFKADIDYKMGAYTGLDVNTDKMPYDGLMEKDLIKPENVIYHSPVGEPHILDMDKAINCHLPSVSGKKSGPNAMAMLAYNRSSPECCPATFSNSMGCVCMSPDQEAYLRRGGKVVE